MITITDLHKVYSLSGHKVVALNEINLHVQPGEVFGVLGQSGADKSTLIRCVNQLERVTSGSIKVNAQEITSFTGKELRHARQHIGMIFQHFNLLSSRTVLDNIAFPLKVTRVSRHQRRAKAKELLSLVGLEGSGKTLRDHLGLGKANLTLRQAEPIAIA